MEHRLRVLNSPVYGQERLYSDPISLCNGLLPPALTLVLYGSNRKLIEVVLVVEKHPEMI